MTSRPPIVPLALALLSALGGGGCSRLPEIPLTTPEPLTVNINVKMDVYQHKAEGAEAAAPAPAGEGGGPAAAEGEPGAVTPEARQKAERGLRDRMEEVQTLKNNRLVGENREGLLEVREIPPGEYGAYTEKTVREENADREVVMRALALEEGKPLAAIRREQAQYRRRQSFKGEWVEEEEAGGSWRWVRKAADPR
jgi:hypothetical protein